MFDLEGLGAGGSGKVVEWHVLEEPESGINSFYGDLIVAEVKSSADGCSALRYLLAQEGLRGW